jgi:hypothetical protein
MFSFTIRHILGSEELHGIKFKPQVNDELDTQNFMKFEEVSKSLCTYFFTALQFFKLYT